MNDWKLTELNMLKRESDAETAWKCGADLVVRNLEAQGVRHVFGIPGAKVDRVFDSLVDSSIETVLVRHEANAAFMAAAVGRLIAPELKLPVRLYDMEQHYREVKDKWIGFRGGLSE